MGLDRHRLCGGLGATGIGESAAQAVIGAANRALERYAAREMGASGVYAANGSESIGIQVGRMTVSGKPSAREHRALADLDHVVDTTASSPSHTKSSGSGRSGSANRNTAGGGDRRGGGYGQKWVAVIM